MSIVFRRLTLRQLHHVKTKGSGPPGGFWGEGQNTPGGNLFNESPLPPGQARKWESWEAPWYFAFGAAGVILAVGLGSKPNTSLEAWGREQAQQSLASK